MKRMKLVSATFAGNVHESVNQINKLGLANEVISINHASGSPQTQIVFRMTVDEANAFKARQPGGSHPDFDPTHDDPPEPKESDSYT